LEKKYSLRPLKDVESCQRSHTNAILQDRPYSLNSSSIGSFKSKTKFSLFRRPARPSPAIPDRPPDIPGRLRPSPDVRRRLGAAASLGRALESKSWTRLGAHGAGRGLEPRSWTRAGAARSWTRGIGLLTREVRSSEDDQGQRAARLGRRAGQRTPGSAPRPTRKDLYARTWTCVVWLSCRLAVSLCLPMRTQQRRPSTT
jgi:hypothetical protein